jgi:uracil phosphoribosyltransferase
MSLKLLDRPLARHILAQLRSKDTDQISFRKSMVRLGRLIGYEIADDLGYIEIDLETPVAKAKGISLVGLERITIVNVLRAATPLVEGLLKAFPSAKQGVVVAKRREHESVSPPETMDVDVYYSKLPAIGKEDTVIVADPMLATGSTLLKVLGLVSSSGSPKSLYVACIIASVYGVKRVLSSGYNAKVIAVEVDPELNNKGYIVPGLGDAGDRAFG